MSRGVLSAGTVWLFLLPSLSIGQARNRAVSVAGGAVHNLKTPLHIAQNDFEPIRLQASYRTEPLKPPVYYDVQASTWQGKSGWALRFTHHKLILNNNPPEVQHFSITDGFNLLTLNRLWLKHGFILSAGGGIVITHPESTIRNRPFAENRGLLNKGYYISGPSLEFAVAKQFYVTDNFFMLSECRATASYMEVPIANGNAQLMNLAIHGLLGVGFRFADETDKVKQ